MRIWHRALALGVVATTLSPLQAAPVEWSVNGHYYEFVATARTWQDALAEAATHTFQGLTGHLATLVDAAETEFAAVTVAGGALAWIAASDDGDEGRWTWRAGPESGQALTYFNWTGGEPNNCCGGENYLQINWSGNAWNDHGGPGNAGQTNGYIVEYSTVSIPGVPEPAALGLSLAALAALAAATAARRR